MTTDAQCAYAAGIIDGEGSIAAYKKPNSGYQLRVRVAMITPSVPYWLLDNFEGSVNKAKRTNPNEITIYTWSIYSERAKDFICLIAPYLVEKWEQADQALKFPTLGKGYRPSSNDRLLQGKTAKELSRLKTI